MQLTPVYTGGNRHLTTSHPVRDSISLFCRHIERVPVHVGCQVGADQYIVDSMCVYYPALLHVFAIEENANLSRLDYLHNKITVCHTPGAPIKAQFINRSIQAFTGCSQAIFFQPGKGSLAVAREFIKRMKNPVFAIATEEPPTIPSQAGTWSPVRNSWYEQFNTAQVCAYVWQPTQKTLF